eukprot:snap_masked-scaffold_12-processed-gene-12.55-mRNA-1 protein AED:1.00 eAED:1.00 QI:0/-1/0/0/-1/1/1/0/76
MKSLKSCDNLPALSAKLTKSAKNDQFLRIDLLYSYISTTSLRQSKIKFEILCFGYDFTLDTLSNVVRVVLVRTICA